MPHRPQIATFGSSTIRPGEPAYELALALGRAVGEAGADVITGGYCGSMEAVSRGVAETGGHVVGVTVDLFEQRGPANKWVKERLHTTDLFERLKFLIERADAFVVLPGSVGTLTELMLAWTLVSVKGRREAPIVMLGEGWKEILETLNRPGFIAPELFARIQFSNDPVEAVRLALQRSGAGAAP